MNKLAADNQDEEWFDVVDQQDQVIGSAPRSQVHALQLLHRAAHIWVFNSRNQLLLHLRAAGKVEEPSKWTSSATGHVTAGESYEVAAKRELFEELGIAADLKFAHKLFSGPEIGFEHTALFLAYSDAIPLPDPHEIAELRYLEISEISNWISRQPEQFTNPFRHLWKWFLTSSHAEN